MALSLSTHFEYGRWQNAETDQGKISWRGTLYPRESREPVAFADLLNLSVDEIEKVLTAAAGFFSFVMERSGEVIAVVDRIRSIPLFYTDQQKWLLSDSAEWVRKHCCGVSPNSLAQAEFLLAGYVTGRGTLFEQVKQVRAGELAIFSGAGLETRRYIVFDHEEPPTWSRELLDTQLDGVSFSVFRRLTEYAQGRPIIIPLSGGYDSRFVATMLRRLGYEDVICFSYGVPNNAESAVSQSIAKSLGYRWVFAEYSDETWRKAWGTDEAAAFRLMAMGHSSLPTGVQDWLAVRSLLNDGVLPGNGVVVPGHAGDFVAGSHIPDIVFSRRKLSKTRLISSIMSHHLANAPAPSARALIEVRQNLDKIVGDVSCSSPVTFANVYERWDWEERQAKYIANAVRTYDFFDLDWWMPFWDLEFMNFWRTVPLELRAGRSFFISFIQERYAAAAKIDENLPGNASEKSSRVRSLAKILLPLPIQKLISTLIALDRHPLRFGALVPRARAASLARSGHNIDGMCSRLYLDGEWGKLENTDRTECSALGGGR